MSDAPVKALESMGKLFEEKTSKTLKDSFKSVKDTLDRPEITDAMNRLNLASVVGAPLAQVFAKINTRTMDERVAAMSAVLELVQTDATQNAIKGLGKILNTLMLNFPAIVKIVMDIIHIAEQTGSVAEFEFKLKLLIKTLKALGWVIDRLTAMLVEPAMPGQGPFNLPPEGDFGIGNPENPFIGGGETL
jgi:hypothetical protein